MNIERNTIYHCDAVDLLVALADDSIDMILTSPPYDNLRTYGGHSEFDFEAIAQDSYRVLKPGGVLVWIVGDATINGSETLTSMRQALYFVDVVGFKMHDTMIYHKHGSQVNNHHPRYIDSFEYMFILSKGRVCSANLQKKKNKTQNVKTLSPGTKMQRNGRLMRYNRQTLNRFSIMPNVWLLNVGGGNITKDKDAYQHPAMFPEKLAERHILTWSNPGDVVLDYFMGSGTSAKMARNNGRDYIGCDVNADYVKLARERLAKPYTVNMFNDTPAAPMPEQVGLFDGLHNDDE